MSILYDVAMAVAGELSEYNAEFTFLPDLEVKDSDVHVLVAPRGIKYKKVSRQTQEKEILVDVGIKKKVTPDEPIVDLLTLVQQIAEQLPEKRLSAYPSAVCIDTANDPVYSPEHLRQQGKFISVITFTYKVME